MKMVGTDPDLATIVSRIRAGDLDLQPDFQRGEVWSDSKKRRLIDTILRGWHVPPVHVIELSDSAREVVLDGQQRLAAVRDFVENKITVDGSVPPHSEEIARLDGTKYSALPADLRRRFDRFQLRVVSITEYTPDEPGELFFRLNQPTNLTSAEQRNAFFGQTRQQVRELVSFFHSYGPSEDFVGFSNSRMAIDDIIARLCVAIELNGLETKITAGLLSERYRSGEPFDEDVLVRVRKAASLLSETKDVQLRIRFNKATLFSLLYFLQDLGSNSVSAELGGRKIAQFVWAFDEWRSQLRSSEYKEDFPVCLNAQTWAALLTVYEDRSTSRVQDIVSVRARDAILWLAFYGYCDQRGESVAHQKFAAARRTCEWAATGKKEVSALLANFLDEPFLELML